MSSFAKTTATISRFLDRKVRPRPRKVAEEDGVALQVLPRQERARRNRDNANNPQPPQMDFLVRIEESGFCQWVREADSL